MNTKDGPYEDSKRVYRRGGRGPLKKLQSQSQKTGSGQGVRLIDIDKGWCYEWVVFLPVFEKLEKTEFQGTQYREGRRLEGGRSLTFMTEVSSSGRPTVAEVNLKALEFNYRQIRKRIPKEAKVLGVVKADAYGHGAVPVSLTLESLGVEYLGVAIPNEGVDLRKGGVKTPILVLGGVFSAEDVVRVLRFHLTPVVFQTESLRHLSKEGTRYRKRVKVHIKVDTGMGRLGVSMDEWDTFLKEVKRYPNIEVEGILSHFAMGDEDGGAFSQTQWEKFRKAVARAEDLGISYRYLHMANSVNLSAFPAYSGNLVRPGIMLYGSYPSPALQSVVALRPVMTLKTRIHLLKAVPPGARISYGGTFTTHRKSLIATLPIGYADGYRRDLSNVGEVLVRGRRAPVVGRVCMDYILVDVTDIPAVSSTDEVILIGMQGKERITAEEMADKIGSISYEIFCGLGKRVPRVYTSRR